MGDDAVGIRLSQPTSSTKHTKHQKRRTIWTEEMNSYIVRCYYLLTKNETVKVPYTVELHKQVTQKFPEIRDKTLNNILSQKRSIFENNRLSAEIINAIKNEVAVELGMVAREDKEEAPDELIDRTPTTGHEIESKYALELNTSLMMYDGVKPASRPRLPKLEYNKDTNNLLKEIDRVIGEKLASDVDMGQLYNIVYAGALAALTLNGQRIADAPMKRCKKDQRTPPWQKRLELKIAKLRKSIGILTQSLRNTASARVKRAAETIIKQYQNIDNPTVVEVLDLLKQTLAANAKKLRRYKTSHMRKTQNRQFARDQRTFYRGLKDSARPQESMNRKAPSPQEVREFWSGIWNNPIEHRQAKWISEEHQHRAAVRTMLDWEITTEDVQKAIRKAKNWKAPGPDMLQNFWLKRFTSTHSHFAACYMDILRQPQNMPDFMAKGITYLLPKSEQNTQDPAKYRPITCLPTIYKLLTAIISDKIYQHLQKNNLLDEEQKGCRRGSRGCKEQLVIDSVVMGNAKRKKQDLFMAYIDYQKAFDSVPHTWLLQVLKIYRVQNHIIDFLSHSMTRWNTTLLLKGPELVINAGEINIRRGIFQGDALSPLWFCLALKPLTTLLTARGKGYCVGEPAVQISHLWYMDDLKLYASRKNHLHELIDCVGRFSRDIGMSFGLDKCKINCMVKGEWGEHEGRNVGGGQGLVGGLEEYEHYKYLGYLQARGINHKTAKEQITDEYQSRLKALFRTKLSAINMSRAINAYATSVLTYGFGVIGWTDTDLERIDIRTRSEARRNRAHHPQSAVERFHLPRGQGGRGVPSACERHYAQVQNLRQYFITKADNSSLHRAVVQTDVNLTPLKLANRNYDPASRISTVAELKEKWKRKPMHGKYPTYIESETIDTKASQRWLRVGNIFVETEGFVAAIQDQVIPTRAYRKRILREDITNTTCRLCANKEETLDHLMAGCSVLAPKAYLDRHNHVAKILHQQLRRVYMGTEDLEPYYKYDPPAICEDDETRIYWNRTIITDKPIPNNIPDIVVTLKKKKQVYIIDIAVPLAVNTDKTYSEKINKYLPLSDEIKAMWDMEKATIVPIILGATGEVPYKLHRALNTLELNNNNLYTYLQKAVLLDTCSIIRRVLS